MATSDTRTPRASERLAAFLGLPVPDLSAERAAEFRAWMADADARQAELDERRTRRAA